MKYGQILKQLREEKGLSQQELADKFSINRSTYARYETSSTQPDYSILIRLADFYDVSVDYLLGREHTKDVVVIAAHRSDNELDSLPEEAFREIENFKEFIRLKYGNINKKGE